MSSPQVEHPQLVQMIESASRNIEAIYAVSGHVAAMWHWINASGDHVVMLAPPVDKFDAVAIVREVLKRDDAVAVLFIDEAWTFAADPQEAKAWLASGRTAIDHPRRVEVVHFAGEDETGALSAWRVIERKHGQPPTLGPLQMEAFRESVGLFTGMLPRRKGATLQ